MKPLVSILIPSYNAELSIADTINSALKQTWLRKEIILVEDGSTDAPLSVARQFFHLLSKCLKEYANERYFWSTVADDDHECLFKSARSLAFNG